MYVLLDVYLSVPGHILFVSARIPVRICTYPGLYLQVSYSGGVEMSDKPFDCAVEGGSADQPASPLASAAAAAVVARLLRVRDLRRRTGRRPSANHGGAEKRKPRAAGAALRPAANRPPSAVRLATDRRKQISSAFKAAGSKVRRPPRWADDAERASTPPALQLRSRATTSPERSRADRRKKLSSVPKAAGAGHGRRSAR